MGSEKAKKGRARFMKPFLYDSSFLWPWTILSSSRQTRPTTAAVVVAMAGMILPAISLLCMRESGFVYTIFYFFLNTNLLWPSPSMLTGKGRYYLPCVCLQEECHNSLLSDWTLLLWSPCGSLYHHPELKRNFTFIFYYFFKSQARTPKIFSVYRDWLVYLFKVYGTEFELGCCLCRRQEGFQLLKPRVIYKRTGLSYKETHN